MPTPWPTATTGLADPPSPPALAQPHLQRERSYKQSRFRVSLGAAGLQGGCAAVSGFLSSSSCILLHDQAEKFPAMRAQIKVPWEPQTHQGQLQSCGMGFEKRLTDRAGFSPMPRLDQRLFVQPGRQKVSPSSRHHKPMRREHMWAGRSGCHGSVNIQTAPRPCYSHQSSSPDRRE